MFRRFLVSNGFSKHQADTILGIGDVQGANYGLTAVGTNFATAYALHTWPNAESWITFTTVASGTGSRLPPMEIGDEVYMSNLGANALLIYPEAGGSFNLAAADAAFSVATTKTAFIKRLSATKYVAFLSA